MSEEDVRGGLRDAVAEEPPLDFDADELVARARRQVMRQRTLLAAAATVVVAVAAVAIPLTLSRGPAPVADRPAASSAMSSNKPQANPTPTTSPLPAEPHRYTEEDLRRRGQQMGSHLLRVVPRVLPKASEFDVGEFGGEAAGDFHDGQTYVNAPVSFTIAGARYSIFITLWAPGAPAQSLDDVCATECQRLGEQDGGQLVAKTEDLGDQVITTVYHFRANGGIAQVAGYNYDMSGHTQPVYQPTMPMTVDQLKSLATDPELGL